jgi:hypothetical protein
LHLRKHRRFVLCLRLKVDGLESIAKVLWTVNDDRGETQQKNYDNDDDVSAGRGRERACGEARRIGKRGGGENRTWSV